MYNLYILMMQRASICRQSTKYILTSSLIALHPFLLCKSNTKCELILVTDVLGIAHLRIVHQVCTPEVGKCVVHCGQCPITTELAEFGKSECVGHAS